MESVVSNFNGLTSGSCGSAFFGRAHGEGLGGGGADDHNVKGSCLVIAVGVHEVGTLGGAVCSGHKLLLVDGGMPPLVEDAVEGVCDGVMTPNGSRSVGATDGVVSVRVAVCGAGGSICAPVGTWAGFQNDIIHPNADADVENRVRHVVARGRRELEPRAPM